jgi:hypothetical protein
VLPIALAEPLLKPTGEGAQWAHTPHPPSSIHFAMAGGIPQDKAAAIAIGLEGILYGEYIANAFIRSMLTNVGFFRLFTPHVFRYYLGVDLQTTLAEHQSPNCFRGHPAVGTEHCS